MEVTENYELQTRMAEAMARACDVIGKHVAAEDHVLVLASQSVVAWYTYTMIEDKKNGHTWEDVCSVDQDEIESQTTTILERFGIPTEELDPDNEGLLEIRLVQEVMPIVWGEKA